MAADLEVTTKQNSVTELLDTENFANIHIHRYLLKIDGDQTTMLRVVYFRSNYRDV